MDEPEAAPVKAGKRQWTCRACRKRLSSRMRENDAAFEERCAGHRRGQLCPATALANQLLAAGMLRLIEHSTGVFRAGHTALKDAGLVQQHRTREGWHRKPKNRNLLSVTTEPWAPSWAVRYETHLSKQGRPFAERLSELQAAAASPESIERVCAFLVLVDGDRSP